MLFKPGQKVMSQHPRSAMNVEMRKIYDCEYGHHMKAEIGALQLKAQGGDAA